MRKKRVNKNKKDNFFIKNYKKSLDYLKESKNYIYSILLLFFIFALVGFFIPAPAAVSEKIFEFITQIIEQTENMSFLELVSFIFFNNLKVSLLSIILGLFFGVIPIAFSITNGYLLGFVSSITAKEEGVLSLWRILPHGIFELPAVFISIALGLRIGFYLFLERKKETLSNQIRDVLRIFVLIVIPLLFIAAIIESYLIIISR